MATTTDLSTGPVADQPFVDGSVVRDNGSSVSGNIERAPACSINPSVPKLPHDTTPTPPTSDPGATYLTTNPPQGKALNAVITGVGVMHTYCVELQLDHFFMDLLPGPDPSEEDLSTFAFPEEKKLKGVREWEVNLEIVSGLMSFYFMSEKPDHFPKSSARSRLASSNVLLQSLPLETPPTGA